MCPNEGPHFFRRGVNNEIHAVTKNIQERAKATNGKYGPVNLSKNENVIEKVLKVDYPANESLLILCLWL